MAIYNVALQQLVSQVQYVYIYYKYVGIIAMPAPVHSHVRMRNA